MMKLNIEELEMLIRALDDKYAGHDRFPSTEKREYKKLLTKLHNARREISKE